MTEHPPSTSESTAKSSARFSPTLLVFIVFPLFGLAIALITGISRSTVSDSSQIGPPDTLYKPTQFVGAMAPDFTIKTASGSIFRLSDWRGDVVFLNFWATWCAPCRLEMSAFQQVIDGKIPGKAMIFAVDIDPNETASDINRFESSLGVHVPAGMDFDGAITNLYQIIPIPHTFVIDKQGVIRYDQLGTMTPDILRAYLAKLSPVFF